ncbi:hypothetical protein HWQ46_20895 [Shewanella sp. D64]|uniref:hypothetical protein n=1 Tax=unclassified Shewanella TaxID=196818 RepID=UPI0022BA6CBE|nr:MULTISPECIES: hypothetical protein [unclassified Shewanella]MEC4727997.1 hypothetical protein [Shewanella sp. D64]MEC4740158.1 hypothetical protein [Shewanella sp. E94]WBJ95217.1 hypothetical protein HWQ47_26025 [Shewanella sp. MTB7]
MNYSYKILVTALLAMQLSACSSTKIAHSAAVFGQETKEAAEQRQAESHPSNRDEQTNSQDVTNGAINTVFQLIVDALSGD